MPCTKSKHAAHGRKHSSWAATLASTLFLLTCSLATGNSFAAEKKSQIQPPAQYAQSGTIRYCTVLTNPPHNYLENGKPTGLDVDLAQAMAGLMDLKVKWIQLKFAGLIPALRAGQCAMIVEELYIKPARKKIIDFIPFAISAEQIVVRQDSTANIKSINDLADKKVAVTNGTTFQQILLKENKKLKAAGKPTVQMLTIPNANGMFNQVMSGTADAAGATLAQAAYYNSKTNGRLKMAGEPFHKIKDGFGVREDADDLRQAMAKALHQLMESGRYDKIFAKYQLESAELNH